MKPFLLIIPWMLMASVYDALGMSPFGKTILKEQAASSELTGAIYSDNHAKVGEILKANSHHAQVATLEKSILLEALHAYIEGKCAGRVIATIINAGVSVHLRDCGDNTPLHIIVSKCIQLPAERQEQAKRLIKFLLASGAKTDRLYAYAKNSEGCTIFDIAQQEPHTPIAQLLELKRTLDLQNCAKPN